MTNKSGVIFVEKTNIKSNKNTLYVCRCPLCGKTFKMWSSHFYRGSNGCECRHIAKKNPRLHSIWINIKTRCHNSNSPSYKNYGGRGIKVCEEWNNNFKDFCDWAIKNGYNDKLTIDRIDVNGNYEPNNCRWADIITQANNKRNNIIVKGKSLRRFCEENNLNYKTEYSYISRHGLNEWYENKLMELEDE